MLDIILPLSGIIVPILKCVHTLPVSLVIEPVPRVLARPTPVLHLSKSLSDALNELALELIATVRVKDPPVAMHGSIHELPLVQVTLGGDHARLTCELAVHEPALLDCAVL